LSLPGASILVPANSDCPHPLADPAPEIAEGDAREPVVVADAAVRLQARADIGDPAQDRLGAERVGELIEVDETVEQRQHRGSWPDRGTDRRDRLVEVVMLGGQQDQVIGAVEPVGGRELRPDRKVA
jgi:hypothetical protein